MLFLKKLTEREGRWYHVMSEDGFGLRLAHQRDCHEEETCFKSPRQSGRPHCLGVQSRDYNDCTIKLND